MSLWFRSLKYIGIVLLLIISLLWILSLAGVLFSSWSTVLGAVIAVLALFLGFSQWVFPLPPHSKDQAYQTLLRQFKSLPTMNNGTVVIRTSAEKERAIYATRCPPEVLANMRARYYDDEAKIILFITLRREYTKAVVENYIVDGELAQIALFPSLGQDKYVFWTPRTSTPQGPPIKNYSSYATVHAGQVTQLDWRYGASILQLK